MSNFPSTVVKGDVFSSAYVFGTFLKNQMAVAVWVYFWALSSMCLFLCQYHAVFVTVTLWYILNSSVVMLYLLRID
jgi:hypothetical protein